MMLLSSLFLSVVLFLLVSRNLLLSLILLELIGFLVVCVVALYTVRVSRSDFTILYLFSILVIEGVIALSGIISFVSFTGRDSVSSSRVFKC